MDITLQHGYPDYVGKRQIFCGNAKGPSSYSQTTKDAVNSPRFQMYFDAIFSAQTVSGTYFVTFKPSGAGPRATWKAVWWTIAGMTEVANAVDLSGETINVGGFCGQY